MPAMAARGVDAEQNMVSKIFPPERCVPQALTFDTWLKFRIFPTVRHHKVVFVGGTAETSRACALAAKEHPIFIARRPPKLRAFDPGSPVLFLQRSSIFDQWLV